MMKRLVFWFVTILIICQFLSSCGSETGVLSQFSKRKYLKNYKFKNTDKELLIEKELLATESIDESQIYSSFSDDIILKYEIDNLDEIHSNELLNTNKAETYTTNSELNEFISNQILNVNSKFLPDSTYHVYIDSPQEKKLNFDAVMSVVGTLVGLPIFPLIWGLIGLNQIKKHPDKYYGKGWAIVGIILGTALLITYITLMAVFVAI